MSTDKKAKSLYGQRSSNVAKTWFYMTVFVAIFAALGLALAYYYDDATIFWVALAISILMNFFSYWFSDKVALNMAGAKELKSRSEHPEFWNAAQNISIASGLPMPKLYIINDPIPNAFATGRNKNNSVVAATTGLLSILNKNELEGVIAHEFAHIGNKDILLQTIVVIMVTTISYLSQIFFRFGSFSRKGDGDNKAGIFALIGSILAIILAPLAATIVQLAISRKREFLADATGAIITRYPEGLASALEKISQFNQPLNRAKNSMAHMYIVNPMGLRSQNPKTDKVSWFSKMFMTHPPVGERINALLNTNQK